MSSRPRVIATRRYPDPVEALFRERFDAVFPASNEPGSPASLQRALGEADAILCTLGDRFTAAVFAAYPMRARMVANYGAGTDHIDLVAATAHEIVVTNTPDVLTDDTADIAITLMLMAMRRAGEGERELRRGEWGGWMPTHMLGTTVTGKILGIIGSGRIARAVARRAHHGFGMKVIYFNPRRPAVAGMDEVGATPAQSLDELLATVDVLSLHVPSTPETRGMIDGAAIATMRPGTVLINTARGDVIDDDAVIDALASRRLGAAGLDVYRGEPQLDRRYLDVENAVLLPHLGSATVETRTAMGVMAADNISAFFEGREPPNRLRAY